MSEHILLDEIFDIAADCLPLHMPGHKRRVCPVPSFPYGWDITEVQNADELHDATGILAQAMERTAALCGAKRTWYLVNGSTGGLLAGIRALAPCGSEILAARNCHKAVYHAIELGNLTAHWLVPPVDETFGIYGSISPSAVETALTAHPAVRCVVLTSPTYEGVLSDLAAIAKICHAHGVPFLVDEAHGAHYLPLARLHGWQGGALESGADVVVQSAHKTLPSPTQTALLHLGQNSLADADEIQRQLDIFETSSPSYPLLAALDGCTGWLNVHGDAAFAVWRQTLTEFDRHLATLPHVKALCHGSDRLENHPAICAHDSGKILLNIGQAGAAKLRRYALEPEMVCGRNLLAMTSPCDDESTLGRLFIALQACEQDKEFMFGGNPPAVLPPPGKAHCTIAEALRQKGRLVLPESALGCTAAEYVWAYPPGVPLLAPGEEVTAAFLAAHQALTAAGTRMRHSASPETMLWVLD